MLKRKADRNRLLPSFLDGDFLGGPFPEILNERGATAIGQALSVVADQGELMLAHDGTSTASKLAHHLGTGATLQGADVTSLGAATLDELRFELMQERLNIAAYVAQQIDLPNKFQICLLDASGESWGEGSELQAVAKLASRDAFLPPVQIGRIIELPALDREHYCQTLITASRLFTSRAPGLIVSNAPNPAVRAILTDLATALQQRQTNLQLLMLDADHEHGGISRADKTSLTQRVGIALTENRACLGLVWHDSRHPPDVLDDTGAHVAHSDIMALIAACVLNEHQDRIILVDETSKKQLLKLQKAPQSRNRMLPPGKDSMSATMRVTRAAYGFRHPSAHYFSNFHYSRNGLAAALFAASLITPEQPLSQLIGSMAKRRSSD